MADDLSLKKAQMLAALEKGQQTIQDQAQDNQHKVVEAVVAFVDMLGTSELMEGIEKEDVAAEKAYSIIKGISKEFRALFDTWFKSTDNAIYMEISDSFVIAADTILLESLIKMLSLFQFDVLQKHKQTMRGGIAMGKIVDGIRKNEGLIIGPAFTRAHCLEMNVAIFPRIVLGAELKEIVPMEFVAIDKDGELFLSFINTVKLIRGAVDISEIKEFINKEYNNLETAKKPHKISDTKIKQKYGWIKNIIISSTMEVHHE